MCLQPHMLRSNQHKQTKLSWSLPVSALSGLWCNFSPAYRWGSSNTEPILWKCCIVYGLSKHNLVSLGGWSLVSVMGGIKCSWVISIIFAKLVIIAAAYAWNWVQGVLSKSMCIYICLYIYICMYICVCVCWLLYRWFWVLKGDEHSSAALIAEHAFWSVGTKDDSLSLCRSWEAGRIGWLIIGLLHD